MEKAYQKELEVAVAAVREAAQLCGQVQVEISSEVLEKQDRSPVTVADFGSQALVCRTLHEAFREDPIIAEEDAAVLRKPENEALLAQVVRHVGGVRAGAEQEVVCSWVDWGGAAAYSGRFWTLDPIDGTKGFLRGEQYAIALALLEEGQIVVAALACPNLPVDWDEPEQRGAIYTAVRGDGAYRRPLSGPGQPQRVRVSALRDPARARFCESVESSHSSHGDAAAVADRLGIRAEPVRLDSQAKYAVVARGDADLYLRLPTRPGYVEKIWDHAAGVLVVTEAGGRVTDIEGKPLEFHHGRGLERNTGVVVSNGALHEDVLAALAETGVA